MKKSVLDSYVNKRSCAILGFGVSNRPLARLLLDMGTDITVYDKKEFDVLGDEALELSRRGARFVCGEDAFLNISEELIFRSPGIRPDIDGIRDGLFNGAELTSEAELTLKLTCADTFGITGSDGKTTTTTLTGRFLQAEAERLGEGRVFVGGNIGEPLLHRIDTVEKRDKIVMELSSFQLMTVKEAPKYSAITNISPNHLDWHKGSGNGMDEYVFAKKNIVGENTERLVTNAESPLTANICKELSDREKRPCIYLFSSKRTSFDEIFTFDTRDGNRAIYLKNGIITLSDGKTEMPLLDTKKIKVPGIHNVENFMTAIGLTYGLVAPEVYCLVAEEFYGVRHRLELVRTLDGVDYYNSSIDSSPSRTAAALSALKGRDIVVICGGYDKKRPYAPLADALCDTVRAVVLTGATRDKIRDAILSCPKYEKGSPELVTEPDFEAAVKCARGMSAEGGCVLLSPASASFDAFPNFAVRGDRFCDIVNNFKSEKN